MFISTKIFDGFNWHVQEINGHDHNEISKALKSAQSSEKPSLIIGKTVMAKGAANVEGDHNTHGAPFSQDEIILTKKKLGLPSENFYCPNEVKEYFQRRFKTLIDNGNKWKEKLKVRIKGQELAHIVHVEDVANAAMFFLKKKIDLVVIHTHWILSLMIMKKLQLI